jgi:hypothetical protein
MTRPTRRTVFIGDLHIYTTDGRVIRGRRLRRLLRNHYRRLGNPRPLAIDGDAYHRRVRARRRR